MITIPPFLARLRFGRLHLSRRLLGRLLFGAGLAALFVAGCALVGAPFGPTALLSAVGLALLPSLLARALDKASPAVVEEIAAETERRQASARFEATGAKLLGHEGRPFAFSNLSEARRRARRYSDAYGIIACDGAYFLTDRHIADRDMARAHIRATYALTAGGDGSPVPRAKDAAPASPRAITTADRLLETQRALRNVDPLDRLAKEVMGSGNRMKTA